MIMAIPPFVSLLGNGPPHPVYPCSAKEDYRVADMSKPRQEVTVLPKKRSFDVAFLISQDEKRCERAEDVATVRSAFKKVGVGLSKFPAPESRSPSPMSPIDPTRTPSPYDLCEPAKKKEDCRSHFSLRGKEMPKSPIFLGGSLVSPVSVGLARSSFLPSPIFGPSPALLPSGFVTASLLPPSLAALSLPAQNVCAKCNVSFRMTSDLVYHMRSHHKNDHTTADQLRRRRELDKLKCPVCNESFRERHHLTRHMTAHQDKEGDNVETTAYRAKLDYDH